ncbi:MAG: DUF2191 domain-containing protein [Deltaproteobacteria bacterium]|nr:DUF2191 domain-containing protein [Deltaproteobacteria bacterium]
MGIRTTIVMTEELLAKVRQEAAERGWNLSRTIAELVQAGLQRKSVTSARRKPFRFPTFKGRLQPGVDLDDRDRLHDLMDGR